MSPDKEPLIIITGPTAAGKTDTSIDLCKAINGEIISADSIQIYKHMNIGSAKILKEEMQGINHYLIDELNPDEAFSISIFKELASKYIRQIRNKGKIPVIVGGTGFYIQSVLYDVNFTKTANDESIRKELNEIASIKGASYLHDMLKEIDKDSADLIHENNVKRVIRAIEYYRLTGEKISKHNMTQKQNISPYNFAYFVITNNRDVLYERINKRVDLMMEKGLVDEVKKLIDMGYDTNLTSMQGLGYKEIVSYLKGEISLEEAVYIIKRDTRHFAKRQLTWFRREKDVTEINYANYDNNKDAVLNYMLSELKERRIIN